MSAVSRAAIPASLRRSPVVAVLRADHASVYAPVIDSLVTGGVTHIELTLSTAGVFAEMPALLSRFGDAAQIGIGTITSATEARAAIESGASYLVTPATIPAVIDVAVAAGVPVFPGGLTPTELLTGWQAGASAVKLFPASLFGPGYIRDLRGPFPDMEVLPSGGISLDSALEWLHAGACAVSIGGPLLQDAFRGGDLAALTARSRELTSRIAAEFETSAS